MDSTYEPRPIGKHKRIGPIKILSVGYRTNAGGGA